MQHFYFDHNATTPVSPEVLDTLLPAMAEVYGNASSIHYQGQLAKQRLEIARRQVAALLHCDAREIVFVSGGTEANNLAIFGSVHTGQHIVTSSIEHPAVLNPCSELERAGVEVTQVPVASDGIVDPHDIRRALRPNTVLVSIMHANNETGALQPIAEIGRITQEAGVTFHVDGVQAVGKTAVDVRSLGVDLYSMSGHKLYAPKGIGALFVKKGTKLRPLLFGGRHEREFRAGTENVPGAMALGRAALVVSESPVSEALGSEPARLAVLRDHLESELLARVPDCGVNCA
ncbi:MAG: cysteine desulfurase, partial [Acidobacteriota bacterium]|nr:cysteine desulfurase [Acidobacteriota bacterium]